MKDLQNKYYCNNKILKFQLPVQIYMWKQEILDS